MDPIRYAAAFDAARRYSRSERYDAELATWRKALHEAAGNEDDLPFKAFSDWLEERQLASPEMLHRLRIGGAHATPMHFAQHPETGEVVEWPRRSHHLLAQSEADIRQRLGKGVGIRAPIVAVSHGPGGIYAVEGMRRLGLSGGNYIVSRRGESGAWVSHEGRFDDIDAAKSHANHLAFQTQSVA